MRQFVPMAGLAMALLCVSVARAEETKRQFYSTSWTATKSKASSTSFSYKTFKFKVNKTDTTYKEQRVVYAPTVTKNFVHWYNPETKKFWARCPTVNHPTYGKQVKAGKDLWSVLPAGKRKDDLAEIADTDYGKVTDVSPPLPGCKDNVKIDCPPMDLPKDF